MVNVTSVLETVGPVVFGPDLDEDADEVGRNGTDSLDLVRGLNLIAPGLDFMQGVGYLTELCRLFCHV